MGIISNIIERLTISESAVSRVNAKSLIDRLDEPGAKAVVITRAEAIEFKQHLAEKLGRDLVDTPLPDSYNGVQIIVDPEK